MKVFYFGFFWNKSVIHIGPESMISCTISRSECFCECKKCGFGRSQIPTRLLNWLRYSNILTIWYSLSNSWSWSFLDKQMDRAQHLAWILADSHRPHSKYDPLTIYPRWKRFYPTFNSSILDLFWISRWTEQSILLDSGGQPRATQWKRCLSALFFRVHSATLDQKNLVHIYPRTYLQLYISSATMHIISTKVYGSRLEEIYLLFFVFAIKMNWIHLYFTPFGSKHF